jgi:hypothetical protein
MAATLLRAHYGCALIFTGQLPPSSPHASPTRILTRGVVAHRKAGEKPGRHHPHAPPMGESFGAPESQDPGILRCPFLAQTLRRSQ